MEVGHEVVVLTRCNHIFHRDCLWYVTATHSRRTVLVGAPTFALENFEDASLTEFFFLFPMVVSFVRLFVRLVWDSYTVNG
jgi:hypothetical protein